MKELPIELEDSLFLQSGENRDTTDKNFLDMHTSTGFASSSWVREGVNSLDIPLNMFVLNNMRKFLKFLAVDADMNVAFLKEALF